MQSIISRVGMNSQIFLNPLQVIEIRDTGHVFFQQNISHRLIREG